MRWGVIQWDTLLTHVYTCRYAHSTDMHNTPTYRIKTETFLFVLLLLGFCLFLFFPPPILLCLRRAHLQRSEVVEAGVDNWLILLDPCRWKHFRHSWESRQNFLEIKLKGSWRTDGFELRRYKFSTREIKTKSKSWPKGEDSRIMVLQVSCFSEWLKRWLCC